jgi:hypothetical protein
MGISANVFCETPGPRSVSGNLGTYDFEVCPRVGEGIALRYRGVKSNSFIVRRVGHEPAMPDEKELMAELEKLAGEPVDRSILRLYVEFVGEGD